MALDGALDFVFGKAGEPGKLGHPGAESAFVPCRLKHIGFDLVEIDGGVVGNKMGHLPHVVGVEMRDEKIAVVEVDVEFFESGLDGGAAFGLVHSCIDDEIAALVPNHVTVDFFERAVGEGDYDTVDIFKDFIGHFPFFHVRSVCKTSCRLASLVAWKETRGGWLV